MRLSEINLFGVYVSPIVVMMVLAWFALVVLRRIVAPADVLRLVWHPALFGAAIYVIVLSSLVIAVAP
jgi:protein AaeX